MMILNFVTPVMFRHSSRVLRCWSSSKWIAPAFYQQKKYFQIYRSPLLNNQDLFKVSPKGESKLKVRDNVPKEYELIYKAPMESTLRVWCYPTLVSCVLGCPGYIFYCNYYLGRSEIEPNFVFGPFHAINPYVEIWIFAAALALFACASAAVMFKFPFRIYKHTAKQEYVALFLSAIPLNVHLNHVPFSRAAQTKFRNPLYFFMKGCQFTVDKKKALIMPSYFRTPADLCKMLGVK